MSFTSHLLKGIVVFIMTSSQSVFSQGIATLNFEQDKSVVNYGLSFGANQGNATFGEIGLFRESPFSERWLWESTCAYGAGFEFAIGNRAIYGVKATARLNWNYLEFGTSLIHYFEPKMNQSMAIRPEIGAQVKRVVFTYGYNFQSQQEGFPELNKHVFSLRYRLDLRSTMQRIRMELNKGL